MLSLVLQPIDNFSVRQHLFIIRLLKEVFNSRPPRVKILPERDMPLVLQMLQENPFEPLSKASLKFTTFKTILLLDNDCPSRIDKIILVQRFLCQHSLKIINWTQRELFTGT